MTDSRLDETKVRELLAQGHSQRDIAEKLGIPRTTLRDRIKALNLAPAPLQTPQPPRSTPDVYHGIPKDMEADLRELVTWWRDRKASLLQAQDASRQTERTTFHVEKRWVEAIRRQSDLERMTYTQIVNEAFRQYFEGK